MEVLHTVSDTNPSQGTPKALVGSRWAALRGSAVVSKVVCGSDYHAVLTTDGGVYYATVMLQKNIPTSKSAVSSCDDNKPPGALSYVSRLKGLFVVDVAATAMYIVAATKDRAVYTVPVKPFAGIGSTKFSVPLKAFGAEQTRLPSHASLRVSAGAIFFMTLCPSTGALYAGGINRSGQLGIGSDDEAFEVKGRDLRALTFDGCVSAVKTVVCGGCHTVALTQRTHHAREGDGPDDNSSDMTDCDVWVWGLNSSGQLGLGPLPEESANNNTTWYAKPIHLKGVSAVSASCGDYFTVLLSRRDGGSIGVCGKNLTNQLGVSGGEGVHDDAVTPLRWVPLSSPTLSLSQPALHHGWSVEHIASIACGGCYGVGHTVITTADGQAVGTGSNKWGQLGSGAKGAGKDGFMPIALPQHWAGHHVSAAAGWMHTVLWCPTVLEEEIANARVPSTLSRRREPFSSSVESLPPETLNHIIEFLPRHDALVVSRVSSMWYEYVRHCGGLWEGTLQQRFPISYQRLMKQLRGRGDDSDASRYVAYGDGIDYVGEMARLGKERYQSVMSHPEENGPASKGASDGSSSVFGSILNFLSPTSFAKLFSPAKEARTLVLGLDAAGKTSILYTLKLGEVHTTIPTIGFNVETLEDPKGRVRFTCWDVGGPDKIRALWRHYYENVSALMYVVDAADRDRLDEALEQLRNPLTEPLLANIPVLVMVNKMDLDTTMPFECIAAKVRDVLVGTKAQGNISHTSVPRRWCIQGCSTKTKMGLYQGLDWLAHVLERNSK